MGPRFPVSLRISADDFLKGGNTLEDSLRILELCRRRSISSTSLRRRTIT
nr:Uncharacterised protein [Klebsiella pneumoniae]